MVDEDDPLTIERQANPDHERRLGGHDGGGIMAIVGIAIRTAQGGPNFRIGIPGLGICFLGYGENRKHWANRTR